MASKESEDWAVATTQKWSAEVRAEIQRVKHCRRTARYRLKKQGTQAAMLEQHRRLEKELKERLASIKYRITEQEDRRDDSAMRRTIQQLALEWQLLSRENSRLREAVEKHTNFQQLIQSDSCEVFGQVDRKSGDDSWRMRDSRWTPAPPTTDQDENGWRVHLVNGMPSFYFHPFTRDEFEAVHKRCNNTLTFDPPSIEVAGSLFGWTVHHAPLTRREDNSLVAHSRFTRRVRCSFDDADKVMDTLDIDAWPLVFSPPTWETRQREQTCCQVLQEFEKDAYVLVRDIPGPMHFRHFTLAQRLLFKQPDGRRMGTYVTVIADSDNNARSRAAEQAHNDIQWVREGGSFIKFTEIDENTIDVSYDNWSSCYDELHAQHLFIRWAQFAIQIQQWVLPSRLLTS